MQASFLTKSPETFARKLDARTKLLLCFTGSVSVIIFGSPLSLAILFIACVCLALAAAKPKTLLIGGFFASLMMLTTLGFSGLISLAVPGLMKWNVVSLVTPYLRMLIVVMLLMTLALSTPIQVVAGKLQWLRLPGVIYIPISIAIRFIPTFMAECRQVRDAARLRPGTGIVASLRGIVVPLIFRTLFSADDLAIAAELKGIHAQKKATLPDTTPLTNKDHIVLALAACILAVAVAAQVWGPQATKVMP